MKIRTISQQKMKMLEYFRNEEFFKKIYGKNRQEIEKNLVKIKWLRKKSK